MKVNAGKFVKQALVAAAVAGVTLASAGAEALAQGGPPRAMIKDPEGLLQGNAKALSAITTLNWLLTLGSVVATVFFLISAGRKLHDGEIAPAVGSLAGAMVAGISGYVAYAFL